MLCLKIAFHSLAHRTHRFMNMNIEHPPQCYFSFQFLYLFFLKLSPFLYSYFCEASQRMSCVLLIFLLKKKKTSSNVPKSTEFSCAWLNVFSIYFNIFFVVSFYFFSVICCQIYPYTLFSYILSSLYLRSLTISLGHVVVVVFCEQ